jgi:hypothetical protein
MTRAVLGTHMDGRSFVVGYCLVAMLVAACAYFLVITG